MKLLFELDPETLDNAKRTYKSGKFFLAPRVVFLRELLSDVAAAGKKKMTKQYKGGIIRTSRTM